MYNNIDKESDFSFDFRKMIRVLKEKSYICLFTMIIGLIAAIILTVIQVGKIKKDNKYYQATTKVYIDWDESYADITSEIEQNMTQNQLFSVYTEDYQNYVNGMIDQWQKTKINGIITDCTNFMKSNLIRSSLNDALLSNGYDEVNGCDVFGMTSTGTSHLFTITVTSYGDESRVLFLTEKMAQLIMEQGNDKLGLEECRVIDDADSYRVTKSTSKGKDVYERYEEYPDGSKESDDELSPVSLILSKTNIICLIIGFVIGFPIIIIIGLLDNKIYDIEKVKKVVPYPLLGSISVAQKGSFSAVASTLRVIKNNRNYNKVMILAPERLVVPNVISRIVKEVDENTYYDCDVINNYRTIDQIALSDGVVLFLVEELDNYKYINETINKLNNLGANIIGFIYLNTSKKVISKKDKNINKKDEVRKDEVIYDDLLN